MFNPAPAHTQAVPKRTTAVGAAFAGLVALILLGVMGLTWWDIGQDHRLVLASERETNLATLRLLEEHAAQTMRDAERNLDTVISELQYIGRERKLDQRLTRQVIERAQPFNSILKALQYVAPNGETFVGAISYPAYQTDADDRTYVRYLLEHRELHHVVIGTPFRRFYDNELVLPIAKNVFTRDGHYLGLLSTDISIGYFSDVYVRAASTKAIVALVSDQGRLLVRSPSIEGMEGTDQSQAVAFARLKVGAREGTFSDEAFLSAGQRAERDYVFRKVAGYPVTAVLARERRTVLEGWESRTRDRIRNAGMFALLVIALTIITYRNLDRLARSEASLRSSQQQLLASERKFEGMFVESPVPLALLDLSNDRIVEANQSFVEQFGYQREAVIGATPMDLDLWADLADRQPYLSLLMMDREVNELEVRLRNSVGAVRICLLSARLIDADGLQMCLFSPIDVTRQRAVEQEIRELNQELEQRVSLRTQKLEMSNAELAQALATMKAMQGELLRAEKMAALGSLVAGVAHELNTPIGNGLTLASTLQGKAEEVLAELSSERPRRSVMSKKLEDNVQVASMVVRTLQRAAGLIGSFKQVAVDQSSEVCRRFELGGTLTEILDTLKPVYQKKAYRIDTEFEPGLSMDSYPGALGQIITNLVSNSITHGFENRNSGVMHISVRGLGSELVELCFSDDGNGIAPENLQRVFDPFFTTKLGQGGSGLGMHIVYNLVTEVLGGKVTLSSELGKGVRIEIVIPRKAPISVEEMH